MIFVYTLSILRNGDVLLPDAAIFVDRDKAVEYAIEQIFKGSHPSFSVHQTGTGWLTTLMVRDVDGRVVHNSPVVKVIRHRLSTEKILSAMTKGENDDADS